MTNSESQRVAIPPGSPAWISAELIEETLRVWQPYYANPLCGDRMDFTHSKQARGYVEKRRACPNPDCKHNDRVWIKLEVVRVLEVAKRAKVCEPTQNLKVVCEPTQRKRSKRSPIKANTSKLK